ncbi:MAG: D-tyrosyl-tRNA(Tyr) deacylase [Verrucomicrobia bacterium]|nr:D-tyrosyl-tRNA(Tyr) deacylase [Verrucomicrobiota bacterium]
MKVVLQRVLSGSVSVDGVVSGSIGVGYVLLVGIAADDDESTVRRLAADVAKARLMPDPQGKMGVNLKDAGGEALAVSQFTLLADFSKGNRPSFNGAARPEVAKPLFDLFVTELSAHLGRPVPTGVFGADMRVEIVNDGPVTVVLE